MAPSTLESTIISLLTNQQRIFETLQINTASQSETALKQLQESIKARESKGPISRIPAFTGKPEDDYLTWLNKTKSILSLKEWEGVYDSITDTLIPTTTPSNATLEASK